MAVPTFGPGRPVAVRPIDSPPEQGGGTPKWVWYAAGGVVAIAVIMLFLRRGGGTSTASGSPLTSNPTAGTANLDNLTAAVTALQGQLGSHPPKAGPPTPVAPPPPPVVAPPPIAAPPPAAPPPPPPPPPADPHAGYHSYTVVGGDTLWGIAQRFLGNGARWHEIQGFNGDPHFMPIGTQLWVPNG